MAWPYKKAEEYQLFQYISKCSNNHVYGMVMPFCDPAGEYTRLQCSICADHLKITINPSYNVHPNLEVIESFCYKHQHSEYQTHKGQAKQELAASIDYDKKFVEETLKAQTILKPYTAYTLPSTEIEEVPMMGSVSMGVSLNSISISQDILKSIARMSNFNIDLQAKPSGLSYVCRALCTVCKESVPFEYQFIVIHPDGPEGKEAWVSLGIFCDKHKHDGSEKKEVTGRKFKEL